MKCSACKGTGKGVVALVGSGAQLGPCVACAGSGVKESEVVTKKRALPPKGTGTGTVLKQVGSDVAEAFIVAGKQKLAAEAASKMVDLTKDLAASFGYELPDHPLVDKGLALGMPVLLMLCTQLLASSDQSIIPPGLLANVNAASTYALQGVSKEAVDEVAKVAMPFLLQVASIGAQALAAGGTEQLSAGQVDLAGDE